MNKELLEQSLEMGKSSEVNYGQYTSKEVGGIINEGDYNSALTRAEDVITLDDLKALYIDRKDINVGAGIKQAVNMARFAGIELHNTEDALDERVKLYVILRNDKRLKGEKHHHDTMGNQQIFVEALRMLGDYGSVEKMKITYDRVDKPFDYNKEEKTKETA